MESKLRVPRAIQALAEECAALGGKLHIVGGGVRDHLLGQNLHDWDVEVFKITFDALQILLNRQGSAHAVGKSFGVLKWACEGDVFDVAIPRRHSRKGTSVEIIGDPNLDVTEAARRRDLTINAVSYDPLTETYVDPYNGQQDIRDGKLRPVDKYTFLEDPLRVFRAAQFAARFSFQPTQLLVECLKEAKLTMLPAERIQGELFKLFCAGKQPSLGLNLLDLTTDYSALFPQQTTPSARSRAGLDALASKYRASLASDEHLWAAMLTIWLSDTTEKGCEAILDRLGVFTLSGLDIRKNVLNVHRLHRTLKANDATLRNLATECNLNVLIGVARVLSVDDNTANWCESRAGDLNILHAPPQSLLKGRHLKTLGVAPGPTMGHVIKTVYQAQLNGEVTTLEEAIALAADVLAP